MYATRGMGKASILNELTHRKGFIKMSRNYHLIQRMIYLFIAVIYLFPSFINANVFVIPASDTTISNVTVFSSLVKVVRVFEKNVDIAKLFKANEDKSILLTFIVQGLPQNIDDDTVRLEITAKSSKNLQTKLFLNILDSQMSHFETPRSLNSVFQGAMKLLTTLQLQLQMEKCSLQLEQSSLENIKKTASTMMERVSSSSSSSSVPLTIEILSEILAFQESHYKTLNTKQKNIQERMMVIEKDVQEIEKAIQALDKQGHLMYVSLSPETISKFEQDNGAVTKNPTSSTSLPSSISSSSSSSSSKLSLFASYGVTADNPSVLIPDSQVLKDLKIQCAMTFLSSTQSDISQLIDNTAQLTFELTYMSSPAHWTASYDVNVDRRNSDGAYSQNIKMLASVEQSTGMM